MALAGYFAVLAWLFRFLFVCCLFLAGSDLQGKRGRSDCFPASLFFGLWLKYLGELLVITWDAVFIPSVVVLVVWWLASSLGGCLLELLITGSVAISMETGLGEVPSNLPGCFRRRRMMPLSLSLVFV